MKKLLAFLLVLVMILSVSLVACDKKAATTDDDDDDDWGNANEVTDDSNKNNNNTGGSTGGGNTPVIVTWSDIDLTVYVAYPAFLRNSASDTDKTGIKLILGDSVPAVQKSSDDKWYKVIYDDNTYYLYTYVTVTNVAEVQFDDLTREETTVTAGNKINLRYSPCYGGDKYDETLKEINVAFSGIDTQDSIDGKLTITGINKSNTWVRVEFTTKDSEGKETTGTYYCRKTHLAKYQSTTPNPGEGEIPAA